MSEFQILSPIGLVAGNGSLPKEFALEAKAQGLDLFVVAHLGETDPNIEHLAKAIKWVKVGELGKLISFFLKSGVRSVAFAGGIRRIRLFGGVKLDLKGLALIARIGSLKDDAILRAVAAELEKEGIKVISVTDLIPKLTPHSGVLTKRVPSEEECKAATIGFEAANRLGELDIGQTVVINGGIVVAVEAVEGTDQAIERAGILSGEGAVVVKAVKPIQDIRLDLPTIGPGTIAVMRKAGAKALFIRSGSTILLQPHRVIQDADNFGIAISVID